MPNERAGQINLSNRTNRVRKAYRVALAVSLSYLFLSVGAPVIRQAVV
jgi:hypothetical protein